MAAAAVLMASALVAQVWVSVAKPWGRTPLAGRARSRPAVAPVPMLAAAVVVPIADVVLAITVYGQPLPALSLTLLAVAVTARLVREGCVRRCRCPGGTTSRPGSAGARPG